MELPMLKFLNIKIGFTLLICLLLFLGIVSLNKINNISEQTKKIYDHPFTVSQSAMRINAHLISMHRYMKDVVLSRNTKELNSAINEVNHYEDEILKEYGTIFKRYLGERSDIEESYNAFINWKPIREEVIALVAANKTDEAALITKQKGAIHVMKLNNRVQVLVDFASKKANEFYGNTIAYESHAKKIIITILVILIIISVLISKINLDNLKINLEEKDNYLKEIEKMSITDSLTSLYNRRHFDHKLLQYLNFISRVEQNLVFIMFDIDNFKKYNDNYGHKAGDIVLQKLSYALNEKFQREYDYSFRIGGEEFAILFIVDDDSDAYFQCKRLLTIIQELNIEHKYNESYDIVTISIGAGIIKNQKNLNENIIYEKVDSLLYEAKKDGKNRFNIDYVEEV